VRKFLSFAAIFRSWRTGFYFATPILVVLGMSVTGLMRGVEGLCYDALHHLPFAGDRQSSVLMVEMNPSDFGANSPNWGALLDALLKLEPKAIALTALPGDEAEGFHEKLIQSPIVVGGVELQPNPQEPEHPIVVLNSGIPAERAGCLVIASASHGIHRAQAWQRSTTLGELPTLETRTAQIAGSSVRQGSGNYLIDFRDFNDRIPRVDARRVLSGGLISGMVKGRSVIIGFRPSSNAPGIHTPMGGGSVSISPLEFHAAALDTLLRGKPIHDLGIYGLAVALFAFGLITFLTVFRSDLQKAVSFLIICLPLQVLLGWLSLAFLSLWWPVVSVLLVQWIMVASAQFRKAMYEKSVLGQLVLGTLVRTEHHIDPSLELEAEGYWDGVMAFVDQFLNMERAIFLERVPGDHRIAGVGAMNCRMDDIREQRRDFHREPYLSALSSGSPIIVEERLFLNPVSGEIQYLTPLVYLGDVQGFWAFGIQKDRVEELPQFEKVVKDFSLQIAEMLHHQRSVTLSGSAANHRGAYFASLNTRSAMQTLRRQIITMDQQCRIVESLFDRISTPTILYDLLGRLVRINASMSTLLIRLGKSPQGQSAVDFLTHLTRKDREAIKEDLQDLILFRKEISYTLHREKEGVFLVQVIPLVAPANSLLAESSTEPRPFGLDGIIIEMVDFTEFRRLQDLRQQKLIRMAEQIRQELGIFQMHTHPTLATESQSLMPTSGQMEEQLWRVAEWVEDFESALISRSEDDFSKPHPIEVQPPLMGAVKEVVRTLRRRRVEVQVDQPDRRDLVLARPRELRLAFVHVLAYLAEDSVKDSKIHIEWGKNKGHLLIRFKNEGFGMPDERFQSLIGKGTSSELESIRNLAYANEALQRWGGRMTGRSDVGIGTQILMELCHISRVAAMEGL
jgi:hypothetical protein